LDNSTTEKGSDEIRLDHPAMMGLSLQELVFRSCRNLASENSKGEPLLDAEHLSELVVCTVHALDTKPEGQNAFSTHCKTFKRLMYKWHSSENEPLMKAVGEFLVYAIESAAKKCAAIREAHGKAEEKTAFSLVRAFQLLSNGMNAISSLYYTFEYERLTFGAAKDLGKKPKNNLLRTVILDLGPSNLMEKSMSLLESPEKGLHVTLKRVSNEVVELALALVIEPTLPEAESEKVLDVIANHEFVSRSFTAELGKFFRGGVGEALRICPLVHKLLDRKPFVRQVRMVTSEPYLYSFFTSCVKTLESDVRLLYGNDRVKIIELLYQIVKIFESRLSRLHIAAREDLRMQFVSVVHFLVSETNNLIEKAERNKDTDDEIVSLEEIDNEIVSLAFRFLALFGMHTEGQTLLKFFVETHFHGRRSLEKLFSIFVKIQMTVPCTANVTSGFCGIPKTQISWCDAFMVAFRSLGDYYQAMLTKSHLHYVTPAGCPEIIARALLAKDTSDLESDDNWSKENENDAAFEMPKLRLSEEPGDFSLAAEMGDEFQKSMASKLADRLKRLTGAGDIYPTFLELRRNYFSQGLKGKNEEVVCNCVEVPGLAACYDEKCKNFVCQTECQEDLCPAGPTCCNQRFQKKQYAKFCVKKIDNEKGFGLVAQEKIPAGNFISEYIGEVIDEEEYSRRKKKYAAERNFYFMNLSPGVYIDASRKGTKTRFVNHSCDPNCKSQKWKVKGIQAIGIFAIKDIAENEEITFDYRVEEGSDRQSIPVACECRSANCRGWLTGKAVDGSFKKSDKLPKKRRDAVLRCLKDIDRVRPFQKDSEADELEKVVREVYGMLGEERAFSIYAKPESPAWKEAEDLKIRKEETGPKMLKQAQQADDLRKADSKKEAVRKAQDAPLAPKAPEAVSDFMIPALTMPSGAEIPSLGKFRKPEPALPLNAESDQLPARVNNEAEKPKAANLDNSTSELPMGNRRPGVAAPTASIAEQHNRNRPTRVKTESPMTASPYPDSNAAAGTLSPAHIARLSEKEFLDYVFTFDHEIEETWSRYPCPEGLTRSDSSSPTPSPSPCSPELGPSDTGDMIASQVNASVARRSEDNGSAPPPVPPATDPPASDRRRPRSISPARRAEARAGNSSSNADRYEKDRQERPKRGRESSYAADGDDKRRRGRSPGSREYDKRPRRPSPGSRGYRGSPNRAERNMSWRDRESPNRFWDREGAEDSRHQDERRRARDSGRNQDDTEYDRGRYRSNYRPHRRY